MSVAAPWAGVAEVSLAELVGGCGNHGSGSWVEEAGDIPGIFPSLIDPTPPIILGTPRGADPAVVAIPSHAKYSWLANGAGEGERVSYGSAVGMWRVIGVVARGCRAAWNPCWSLRLAVAVDNLNALVAR